MVTQAMNQPIKGLKAQCQESNRIQDQNKDHRVKLQQGSQDNAQGLQRLI